MASRWAITMAIDAEPLPSLTRSPVVLPEFLMYWCQALTAARGGLKHWQAGEHVPGG